MSILLNHYRGQGLPADSGLAEGSVISNPSGPQGLLAHCPAAKPTPMAEFPELARRHGVASVAIKDESTRMEIGSFKALGAAYAIAWLAADRACGGEALATHPQRATSLKGTVFACASAGNHGLSLAVGARLFGAGAVIYLADTVPEAFVARLHGCGAEIRRAGSSYEASMAAAAADCAGNGWTLLSDSSWPGYTELPRRVMEGYLVMAAEAVDQIGAPPSHIFLHAGVGGFAAAMTAYFRACWGDRPTIIVVEPDAAATLFESIRTGRPVEVAGPRSIMGRLDCKAPSHLALGELARHADVFMTITDEQCLASVKELAASGLITTASGAAGLAGLAHLGADREELGLNAESRVLAFITEGLEDTA